MNDLQMHADADDPAPRPAVSVVIPAYNAERILRRAVRSVLDQEGLAGEVEIVIVDDASGDGTAKVIADLEASVPQVTALRKTRNEGPAAARNDGIALARGDWIAVLDADDAFAPGRLARLLAVAEENALAVIADLPIYYDLDADCPAPEAMQLPASGRVQRLGLRDFLRADALGPLDPGLLQPLFRRDLHDRGWLTYPVGLRHGEDHALFVSLAQQGVAFGVLHEAYYIYSTRIGAVSGKRSSGSVTDVDYRAVAAQCDRLHGLLAAEIAADPALGALIDDRRARSLRLNRIYGWTLLRRGEWGLLWRWLRKDRRNGAVLAGVFLAKLRGQRGLPE